MKKIYDPLIIIQYHHSLSTVTNILKCVCKKLCSTVKTIAGNRWPSGGNGRGEPAGASLLEKAFFLK